MRWIREFAIPARVADVHVWRFEGGGEVGFATSCQQAADAIGAAVLEDRRLDRAERGEGGDGEVWKAGGVLTALEQGP